MNANLSSIMPQVVAVWCEELGHEVKLVCYTGFEDLSRELPGDIDVLFVSAFSQGAQLAYALSNLFRKKGAVTVLGGPHARNYSKDARRYFDYVLGFTNREIIADVLAEAAPQRPEGLYLSADKQPADLPGVKERWKFVEATLKKAPTIKIVPMIGSLGCPYDCSFCIDANVDYQPLSFEKISEDLKFLLTKYKRPRVGWHDPNFGVRFNEILTTIEEAVPPGSIDFIAESSLSLLGEKALARLKGAGFKALLPGIESWYEMGKKSKTGAKQGDDKVHQVADHVNMILRYVGYVQTNFVMGMDSDEGDEPWELTRKFLDLAPGAFPAYSLLSAFGQGAPLNQEYLTAGRVIEFPFHFLDNTHAMNVRPKNYGWPEFYDKVIELSEYSFSLKAVARRYRAIKEPISRWINVVRALSSEGKGRIRYYKKVRALLETDRSVRRYFEGETKEVPAFFVDQMKKDLGPFWEHLPAGSIYHDSTQCLGVPDVSSRMTSPGRLAVVS
jgi:hypothetical protein